MERPILFSGPMVRALLDGSKTQTRRVVKTPRGASGFEVVRYADSGALRGVFAVDEDGRHVGDNAMPCPYGAPGDRLWVREAFRVHDASEAELQYRADDEVVRHLGPDPAQDAFWRDHSRDERWRPSIHMPRWASRLTLEISDLRVERVQEITPADVYAEGVGDFVISSRDVAQEMFARLWESINGPRGYGWEANPYVWVVSFKVLASAGLLPPGEATQP